MNVSFSEEAANFLKIIEAYRSQYLECFNEAASKVSFEQYGRGGECLHRGYYCPSIVQDIVIGRSNRGRLLKRLGAKEPDFIYGFDENRQLRTVRRSFLREVIIRQNDSEIGIGISNYDNRIETVSECKYDGGKIKSYALCTCNMYDAEFDKILSVDKELYNYSDGKMSVDMFQLMSKISNHVRYNFPVEDGYLTSYTYEEFNGEEKKKAYGMVIFLMRSRKKDFIKAEGI